MKDQPKLCYIDEPFAYFTTQELEKQWGDDWNDAPYEHNAGIPYEWHQGDKEKKWEIIKVVYEADLETPCYGVANSLYSVEQINKGLVAWLRSPSYERNPVGIFAGITLDDFVEEIRKVKGRIYMEI